MRTHVLIAVAALASAAGVSSAQTGRYFLTDESGVNNGTAEDSPGNLAAKSAVSWAGTHSAAPPPPVHAFLPRRPALALAAVVLVGLSGIAIFFQTSKARPVVSASSAAPVTLETSIPSPAADAAISATTTSPTVLLPLDSGVATAGDVTTPRANAGGGAAPHSSIGAAHVAPVKSARPNVRAPEPPVTVPEPPVAAQPTAEPTNKMKMDMK